MQAEIVGSDLHNLALFAYSDSFFRKPICVPTARFHFYKNQVLLIFSDQINLSIRAAKVTFQDTMPAAYQFFGSQTFTCTAKTLPSRIALALGTLRSSYRTPSPYTT